jgi:hypothetical protein
VAFNYIRFKSNSWDSFPIIINYIGEENKCQELKKWGQIFWLVAILPLQERDDGFLGWIDGN